VAGEDGEEPGKDPGGEADDGGTAEVEQVERGWPATGRMGSVPAMAANTT
jgi:hypothetical protein